jgi:hypothetical protein
MNTIGGILQSGLAPQLAKQFEDARAVLNLWPAILPRHLADTCKPAMLVKGVLTVECLSPSHLYDFHWDSKSILARLRAHVGNKVRRLNLVLEGHV